MQRDIAGAWRLKAWRRIEEDGSILYPFGENPCGILIYTPDGYMAVQMLERNRASIPTDDALGGTTEQRAAAYSSCLAYYGRYQVEGCSVVHQVEGSLFPDWSQTVQERPFVLRGHELTLQVRGKGDRITNEIIWEREGSRD